METLSELDLRLFLARLLCGEVDSSDEETLAADPEFSAEVERRLEACGARLHRSRGDAPLLIVESERDDLSEISRAALALCAIALRPRPGNSEKRPRISVDDLGRRIDPSQSSAYIRRAALGPLEKRGLIKVVKPGQRAEDAYVVAGPALAAIDGEALLGQLQKVGVTA